jgi:hypothetical protein
LRYTARRCAQRTKSAVCVRLSDEEDHARVYWEGTVFSEWCRVVKRAAVNCFELSTPTHSPGENNAKRKEQRKQSKSRRSDAKVDSVLFLPSVPTSYSRVDHWTGLSLCLASEVFKVTLDLPIIFHSVSVNIVFCTALRIITIYFSIASELVSDSLSNVCLDQVSDFS